MISRWHLPRWSQFCFRKKRESDEEIKKRKERESGEEEREKEKISLENIFPCIESMLYREIYIQVD